MKDSKDITPKLTKEEYNRLPIYYCSSCLSLKILNYSGGIVDCYCGDCTSTNIAEGTVDEWNTKYIERYGKPYIEVINKNK